MRNTLNRKSMSNCLNSRKRLEAMFGDEEILDDDAVVEKDDNDEVKAVAETASDNEGESFDELDLDDDSDDGLDDDSDDGLDDDSDDDLDGDSDDSDGEQSGDDGWDVEEDDLFVVKLFKEPQLLPQGWYSARVGRLSMDEKTGNDGGKWVRVTIPFEIKKGRENVTVRYFASRNLYPSSRLSRVIEDILGGAPEGAFNLKELEGRRVQVEIDHQSGKDGKAWGNVVAVKKAS